MEDVFSGISGQDQVISYLKRSISDDAVVHAYLLCGGQYSSKETIALRFAAALVAKDNDEELKKALSLTHPDISIVRGKGASGYVKEQMNSLIYNATLSPVSADCKVFILCDADKLNGASANAFLKTLEEPPHNIHLVLLASDEQAVLETIKSRCQVLTCANQYVAKQADLELFDAMYSIVTGADNTFILETALQIKDAGLDDIEQLKEKQHEEETEHAQFLSASARKEIEKKHKREITAYTRNAIIESIKMSQAWLRDCMLVACGASDLIAYEQVFQQTYDVGTRFSAGSLAAACAAADKACKRISYNVTPQLALEAYFLEIKEALCPR